MEKRENFKEMKGSERKPGEVTLGRQVPRPLTPPPTPTPPPAASSSVVPIPGTFSWPLAARGKPRRGMLRRAVFSDVQRKALEKMFQKQKYISKPDRKKLAAKLGLKDSQVSALPHSPVLTSSPLPQESHNFLEPLGSPCAEGESKA